jgi:hypothetical protein
MRLLSNLINGVPFSRSVFSLSAINRKSTINKYAVQAVEMFRELKENTPEQTEEEIQIAIEPYKGNNLHVNEMSSFLSLNLKDDLLGAYVIGSLGTYEEIPYSDFDALVIISDSVFESVDKLAEITCKLDSARHIMFDYDPLQHHGWFILTEFDMRFYPNHYFPVEPLKFSKSLFPDKGLRLTAQIHISTELCIANFISLSDSIIDQIKNKNYPNNLYNLKSLLSRFMLLPSLYVQANDMKGIFKKYSFDVSRQDFSSGDWLIMEDVSRLRAEWSYNISFFKRWLISKPTPLSRKLAKSFSPSIPNYLKSLLAEEFYTRMLNLALAMKRNIS